MLLHVYRKSHIYPALVTMVIKGV